MAQLRDARTSALILEGTPLELVLAAGELDAGAYLFDDVGEGFDPDTVRQAHAENVAGLKGALGDAKAAKDKDLAASIAATLKDAESVAASAPERAQQAASAAEAAQAELERS